MLSARQPVKRTCTLPLRVRRQLRSERGLPSAGAGAGDRCQQPPHLRLPTDTSFTFCRPAAGPRRFQPSFIPPSQQAEARHVPAAAAMSRATSAVGRRPLLARAPGPGNSAGPFVRSGKHDEAVAAAAAARGARARGGPGPERHVGRPLRPGKLAKPSPVASSSPGTQAAGPGRDVVASAVATYSNKQSRAGHPLTGRSIVRASSGSGGGRRAAASCGSAAGRRGAPPPPLERQVPAAAPIATPLICAPF